VSKRKSKKAPTIGNARTLHGLLPGVRVFAGTPSRTAGGATGTGSIPVRREHHTRSLVIHDNGDSEAPVLSQHPQKLADPHARQQDSNLQPAISPHLSLANEGGNRSKAASIDLDRFGISLHRPWLRSQLDVDVPVVAVADGAPEHTPFRRGVGGFQSPARTKAVRLKETHGQASLRLLRAWAPRDFSHR
jgi:hypothetical protein